jgi:hypothetical protein
MNKWLLTIFLVIFGFGPIFPQEGYHKIEVSGGYSNMLANGILGDGELFSEDLDNPLTGNSINTAGIDLNLNPTGLFPSSPIVKTGPRHRQSMNGFNAAAVYNFSKYLGVKFEVSGHYRAHEVTVTGIITSSPVGPISPGVPGILPIQSSYPVGTVRALIPFSDLIGFPSRQQHYNFLGGLQIKNNSTEKKIKPFAHALTGVSRQSVKFDDFKQREFAVYGKDKFTNTGVTMAFGGGIDIRLTRRIDLRVIQLDYNPVRIKEQQIVAFMQPITNTGIPNNLTFTNITTAAIYSNNDITIRNRWQHNFRIGIGIVFH